MYQVQGPGMNNTLEGLLSRYPDIKLEMSEDSYGLISKDGKYGIVFIPFKVDIHPLCSLNVSRLEDHFSSGSQHVYEEGDFQWWPCSGQLTAQARRKLEEDADPHAYRFSFSWENFLIKMIEHLT